MWSSADCVGFALCCCFCFVQLSCSLQGRFTELPSNMTAKEGEDVEMGCAFQSGTSSVYLEIQWWFIKDPEDEESSEEEEDTGTQMKFWPVVDPYDAGTKISTVKVQGNDISHRLHISSVAKSDEGLYECRVTDANYGRLLEHKVQAYLQVNSSTHSLPLTKSSPLHLTDKKPRKAYTGAGLDGGQSSDSTHPQSTSSSHNNTTNTLKHRPSSGVRIPAAHTQLVFLLLASITLL